MTGWRSTAALDRSVVAGTAGVGLAIAFGDPVLVVLVAPLVLLTALGLLHRPASAPRVASRLDHVTLHEGQGTVSRLLVDDTDDVEHVTRVAAAAPYVAMRPRTGALGALVQGPDDLPAYELSPRRWGQRVLGEEKVGFTSAWAGYRWGPVALVGQAMSVLPTSAPFDSRAEVPHPIGLIGRHRSRRVGDGTEFADIRPFHAGDRLRRIHWRVSLRTDSLHVVTSRAEQDAGVLLVVDALADHGRSGGVDGDDSSLDVTVRAAAAVAEHHVRLGDRVGLRVVGPGYELLGYGAGRRHLRRLLGKLARIRVGEPRDLAPDVLHFRAEAGTVVIVLSPMLADPIGVATAALARRGLPVLVIDTLPEAVVPAVADGTDPQLAELAWRMRRVERDQQLTRLAGLGCPVVPWRGPGTLDDVMRRLARRAQLPQAGRR